MNTSTSTSARLVSVVCETFKTVSRYSELFCRQGEGVAFRGRALVELRTDLGQLPEEPVLDIHNDDVLRVQVSYLNSVSQPLSFH